jgi:aspartate aminotransferase
LDFTPPPWIQAAASKAMKKGSYKYTNPDGLPLLKASVREKFSKNYGLDYPDNMITIGAGCKQLIFNALMASINPGDEVIIPTPYWTSYPEIVKFFGGVPIFADGDPKNHFKLTADELSFRIGLRTRWLILNSPSNPTGAVYSKQELRALGDVLMKNYHVGILCDDVYENLIYDDHEFHSLVRVEPRLKFRTLICNSISKTYALAGLRLGYAAGPLDLIQAMNILTSQSTSNASSLSQAVAAEALNNTQDFLESWKATLNERRLFVHKAIHNIPGLYCDLPQGAFYLYVNCQDVLQKKTPEGERLKTDDALCTYLVNTAGVQVSPGSIFGLSPYFRLSFSTDMQYLQDGCLRIQAALEKLV